MPFDYDAFLADVLKTVPEDQKKTIEEALRAETVKNEISSGYSRQSDYSRKMDELRSAREAADAEIQAEKQRLAEWYAGANRDYQASQSLVQRYRDEYGDLDGFDPNSQHKVSGEVAMTKEEYERKLAEEFERRDRLAISFADTLTDIKLEHKDRFGEKLNTQDLYAHVDKTGLPLAQAYKDFISDRVAAAQKEKFDKELAEAREQGRREALSQASIPVQPDVPNVSQQGLTSENPSTSSDRVSAAAAAWRAAQVSSA